VLPELFGRGIGRQLHERIEAWAREQGARRLSATAHAPNIAARGFAAALGYAEEVVMRGYSRIDGAPIDRIRFGKMLVD
jgi:RimJ/RimL family protein N-acetyltransferase